MSDTFQADPAWLGESQSDQTLAQGKQRPEALAGLQKDDDIRITSLHLMEIARHSLLTRQEEIDLAKQIESGQHAHHQLRHTTDSAERLRLENQVSKLMEARNRLWENNYGLVVAVAKRYIGKGLPF